MNKILLALTAAGAVSIAASSPSLGAAARNYDCSKPGNANKAACKGKATAAAAPKAAPAKTAATKTTVTTKTAAAAPAAAPAKPSMLQRLKTAMTTESTATTTTTKTVAAAPAARHTASASTEDRNPAGAIAQCKDGTYSHAKGRTGACSRHGGVAKWS